MQHISARARGPHNGQGAGCPIQRVVAAALIIVPVDFVAVHSRRKRIDGLSIVVDIDVPRCAAVRIRAPQSSRRCMSRRAPLGRDQAHSSHHNLQDHLTRPSIWNCFRGSGRDDQRVRVTQGRLQSRLIRDPSSLFPKHSGTRQYLRAGLPTSRLARRLTQHFGRWRTAVESWGGNFSCRSYCSRTSSGLRFSPGHANRFAPRGRFLPRQTRSYSRCAQCSRAYLLGDWPTCLLNAVLKVLAEL
jgi:hypothetical protein